jgi:hypothetical protein
MDNDNQITPHEAQFRFYTGPDGVLQIQVLYLDGTVWLTEQRMAELFGAEPQVIRGHLQDVYSVGELDPNTTTRIVRIAQDQEVPFYNLDVVIAVSYRTRSPQALQFRQWATRTLRSLMVRGFSVDDERLEQGAHFGQDYFDRLLARIAEIRSNERRFHQKIIDLYATASDYDQQAEITRTFYRTLQNKLHYATHGYTASELIARRADARLPRMGLTSWTNSPRGNVRKADVNVAKNYLTEQELQNLNQLVARYLDYAELQASRRRIMTMADWANKLDAFLGFYEYDILDDPTRITPEAAKSIAEQEYEKYRNAQGKDIGPRRAS